VLHGRRDRSNTVLLRWQQGPTAVTSGGGDRDRRGCGGTWALSCGGAVQPLALVRGRSAAAAPVVA